MGVGFEGLVEMLKFNREQKTIEEEAIENKECPYCMIPLKENEEGEKSCSLCERVYD